LHALPWLEQLQAFCLNHAVVSHPLLAAFERSDVTWTQAQRFGLLYYPHILRTRRYQAAALATCDDEAAQFAFASILYDEYGEGSADQSHPAIYRQFLRGLGIEPDAAAQAPIVPELAQYIDTHFALCRHDELTAIAVAGLAMEWPIPPMYRKLVAGLRGFDALDESAIELFTGHMELDVEHGAMMTAAIAPLIQTTDDRRRVAAGVVASMDARRQMMDGLWTAVQAAEPMLVSA